MILIEVLGRRGHVVHRVPATKEDMVIGRAYDSDVILDDPYVDPHALRVSEAEDGTIVVHDLGASNTVYVGDAKLEGGTATASEGDVVRVGRTKLRIVRATTRVGATLMDRGGRLGALVARRAAAPVALAVCATFWAITSYAAEIEEFTAAILTGELVGILLLVILWAGGWALVTRLTQGRAAFLEHATWTLLVASISMPAGSLLAVLAFLWPGSWPDTLAPLLTVVLFAVLLDAHLGLATRLGSRARPALAAAVSVSLVVLVYVVASADPAYEAPVQEALGGLYPFPEGLIPTISTEELLTSTSGLEEQLLEMVDGG